MKTVFNHQNLVQIQQIFSRIQFFTIISEVSFNLSNNSPPIKLLKPYPSSIKMKESLIHILRSQNITEQPIVEYDCQTKHFAHLYPNYSLETSRFKEEVNLFMKRKESFSSNVLRVHKIKDQRIVYNEGNPSMQISVLTDYVPWRLHLINRIITYEEALFLLDGAFRGFRELLHRLKFPFLVEDYMIGVDINSSVRVWWNQNFYKNNFPFTLTSEVKLKDMVMSLLRLIISKVNKKDCQVLEQNLYLNGEFTFLALSDKIQLMAQGLKLKVVGINMLKQIPEAVKALSYVQKIGVPQTPRTPYLSRLVSTQPIRSQERIIISPERSRFENQTSSDRFINKRTYKCGFSPDNNQKMKIIKNDIQNLRFSANSERNVNLSTSKSVRNLYSINKGIKENPEIPQVNNLIKQSQIIPANEQMTVSRFIEPQNAIILGLNANPQSYNVCSGASILKRSETMESLELSRIRSLENLTSEKKFFSTERSNNQSKMGASYLKNKFGESEKKLPENMYFTKLFQG